MKTLLRVLLFAVLLTSPCVADYISAREAALKLVKENKQDLALDAFVKLAAGDVTEAQKSDALESAATCAIAIKQHDRALQLAEQIPTAALSAVVQMRVLTESAKPEEIIARFGTSDFKGWPDAITGEALYHRGRARFILKHKTEAEADLSRAVALMSEGVRRGEAALALANNYRENIKDLAKALEAYQQLQDIEIKRDRWGWLYFTGVTSAASVLTEQGRFDEADAMLQRVESEKLSAPWKLTFRAARADLLAARGDKSKAIAIYEEAINLPEIRDWQKAQFTQQLEQLRAAR